MSSERKRAASRTESSPGSELDSRYIGYFECFNRQLFFEAHEVLEELWLTERGTPRGAFYKGLIQLAGAFVHLQKNRPQPAAALFELARKNLEPHGPSCGQLQIAEVLKLIGTWRARLQNAPWPGPLRPSDAPVLRLQVMDP